MSAILDPPETRKGLRGMGLLARFLYALPKSLVGYRSVEVREVPAGVDAAYHRAIGNVLRIPGGDRLLTLSPGAHRVRCALQGAIEPRIGPDGDLAIVSDWAGKLTGAVCRIAGLLHVADHASDIAAVPLEIPGPTFDRAKRLGDYFLAHALAAFQVMGADEQTELAKRVWAWICRQGKREFSEAEAKRAVHATPETIAAAVEKLCERGLIRPGPKPASSGGRPPSQTYRVHPVAGRP